MPLQKKSADKRKQRTEEEPYQLLLQDATLTDSTDKSQDSGLGEYAGSLDDAISDVRSAWGRALTMPMSEILAVYPDFVLVHQYGDVNEAGANYSYYNRNTYEDYDKPIRYDDCDRCWRVPYTFDDEYDVVTFGEPVECELTTVITDLETAIGQSVGGDPDDVADETQDAVTYAVPRGVRRAALRGIELQKKHGYEPSKKTQDMASALSLGTPLTLSQVKAGRRFFEKNQSVPRDKGDRVRPPSKSLVQWLQWGGDSGQSAFARMSAKADAGKARLQAGAIEDDQKKLEQSAEMELYQDFTALVQSNGVDKNGIMDADFVLTTANTINVKNQGYGLDVWQAATPGMQEMVEQGLFLGEFNHPTDGKVGPTERTCVKFTRLQWVGDELHGKGKILPTVPHGKNAQIMVQAGIPIPMSSRGVGTTKKGVFLGQDDVDIVQPGFKCTGFDFVHAGASPNSRVKIPTLRQDAGLDAQGEDMTPEEIRAAIAEALAQNNKDQADALKTLLQSAIADAIKPPDTKTDDGKNAPLDQDKPAEPSAELVQAREILAEVTRARIASRAESLLQDAGEKLPKTVVTVLKSHSEDLLQDASIDTVPKYEAAFARRQKLVQDTFDATPKPAGAAYSYVKMSKEERAPKSVSQMIERLVEHLPDDAPRGILFQSKDDDTGEIFDAPDCVKTPRRQVRKVLENMSRLRIRGGWDGPKEMATLIHLEAGRIDQAREIQNDIRYDLMQDVPDGATAVGAGGAPTSNAHLFPLYTQLYPTLFVNEVSSTQPMDRPDGRIFFRRSYRVTPGSNWTDENGNLLRDRTPTDLAAPPDPTYANDPGEFQQSRRIQLRLASKSVTAETKKLSDETSIEEIMDLQAYHNLDAMRELMTDLVFEVAEEMNAEMLSDMLAAIDSVPNNPRNLVYGTTPPADGSYTKQEWQRYLGRYISAASNELFKVRNGEMTHIIAGPDAWFALENMFALGAASQNGNPTIYTGLIGLSLSDPMFSGIKTYKTNLWNGVNRNRILVLRRGTAWNDTPHVYAPYAQYTSPTLMIPDTMSQSQGYMERAAHFVVAQNALASVTISATQGADIAFPTAP